MNKLVLVTIDSKPTFNITVTSKTTIRDIKSTLKSFFINNNLDVNKYNILFNINETSSLPVMNTRQYDKFSLESVFDQMVNSRIIISKSMVSELNKDELFLIALQLNLPDLLSFCTSSKRINDLLCRKNDIWIAKLNREFPNYNPMFQKDTPRQTYTLLYDLTNLKNKLGLKESIEEIYQIRDLELSMEDIKEIPKELTQLHNLQKLSLAYNQIKEIPKEIGNLTNLQGLYLNGNKIKEIPKELKQLHNLKYLELAENEIKELPKEIGQLHNLVSLYLSENEIKEIPKELGQLHNLQRLWLEHNQIKEIPKELTQLHNLQRLYLQYNQIKEIPKELTQLHNLQELWLYNNQIKEIPKELSHLPIRI